MKKIAFLALLLTLGLILGGCGAEQEAPLQRQLVDSNQRTVTLKDNPSRIVTLSPTFLDLVQVLQGNVVATASSNVIPDTPATQKLDKVGFIFNINTEKVLSVNPDLVIAYQGMHERYLPFFEEMHIPVLVLKLKTYDDVKESLTLLGQALHQEKLAAQVNSQLTEEINRTTSSTKQQQPEIAIIHYSSQGIALETNYSIAGSTAQLLGLHNVINDCEQLNSLQKENEFVPYSLEMLIQQNPEVIFVTTMGTKNSVQDFIQEEIIENPSWSTIQAVKNKRVYCLPENLFLINPGLHYPEAVKYMADKITSATSSTSKEDY